ncbi:T9SS type A sorting domain-containing protein [bacterium]|nr:T9SS type A sorting domain-containing protein [bacterium]
MVAKREGNGTIQLYTDEFSVVGDSLSTSRLPFADLDNWWRPYVDLSTSGRIFVANDMLIRGYESDGSTLAWSSSLPGTVTCVRCFDGLGVLVASRVSGLGAVLTRYSEDGDELWSEVWPQVLAITDMERLADGRLLMIGQAQYGEERIHIACYSPTGEMLWVWQGRSGYTSIAMTLLSDNHFILTGYRDNRQWQYFMYLAEFAITDNPNSGVGERETMPIDEVWLLPVYPNPFNVSASVSLSLNRMSKVNLTLYDLLGRPVRTLAQNQQLSAGEHRFAVDGAGLASGTYILSLDAGTAGVRSRRITLVK